MRKITEEAVKNFMQDHGRSKQNMKICSENGITYMKLHGNIIAQKNNRDVITIRTAGRSTTTTKERLNGLPGVHIQQKDFVWFLNGVEWNGEWKTI